MDIYVTSLKQFKLIFFHSFLRMFLISRLKTESQHKCPHLYLLSGFSCEVELIRSEQPIKKAIKREDN